MWHVSSLLPLILTFPLFAAPATDQYGDSLPDGVVVRLGCERFREHGSTHSQAFSADGKLHLTCGGRGIHVWDLATGKCLRTIPGEEFVASHDKTYLLCREKLEFVLRGFSDGKEVRRFTLTEELKKHLPWVHSFAICPKNHSIAVALSTGHIAIWDLDHTLPKRGVDLVYHNTTYGSHFRSAAFSPDGLTLAIGTLQVNLIDVATGKRLRSFGDYTGGFIDQLVFSPDGKAVYTGGFVPEFRKWDVETGKRLEHFPGTNFRMMALSPDGKLIGPTRYHNDIVFWDTDKGLPGLKLPLTSWWNDDPRIRLSWCSFTPDGKQIIGGDNVGSFCTYDIATKQSHVLDPRGHIGNLSCVAVTPDGKQIVTGGGGDSSVCIWDADGRLRHTLRKHQTGVTRLAVSPNGRWIASVAYQDPRVLIWDRESGKPIAELPVSRDMPLYDIAFLADGSEIVASGLMSKLLFWSTADWKPTKTWNENRTPTYGRLAIHPDGKLMAVSDYENLVSIWDLRQGKVINRFASAVRHASWLEFSPNGRMLATKGSETGTQIWNIDRLPNQTGPFPKDGWNRDWRTLNQKLISHLWARLPNAIGSSPSEGGIGAFDPASQYALTSGDYSQSSPSGRLELREINTGGLAWSLTSLPNVVSDIAIFPDGKRAVVVGSAGLGYVVDLTYQVPARKDRILSDLWSDLANPDSAIAYAARLELKNRPAAEVAGLSDLPEPWSRIEQSLLFLDDDREKTRQNAKHALLSLGRRALPAIQAALEANPPEQRAERLRELQAQITALSPAVATLKSLRELRFADIRVGLQTPFAIQWSLRLAAGDSADPLAQLYRAEIRRQWKKPGD